MEITKTMVENWLETYLSNNPNADSFDLTMAAMSYGFALASKKEEVVSPRQEQYDDYEKENGRDERIMREWFDEQPFNILEQIVGRKYTEFDDEDGYQEFVDYCEDFWNGLSGSERRNIFNKFCGCEGYCGRNDHEIKDTDFGDVYIEDGLLYCMGGEVWYHLPNIDMTDDEIRRFIHELYEFEK